MKQSESNQYSLYSTQFYPPPKKKENNYNSMYKRQCRVYCLQLNLHQDLKTQKLSNLILVKKLQLKRVSLAKPWVDFFALVVFLLIISTNQQLLYLHGYLLKVLSIERSWVYAAWLLNYFQGNARNVGKIKLIKLLLSAKLQARLLSPKK